MCNNEIIKGSQSVKYLGVTLDQFLSGDDIAFNIIKKGSARLKFFYRKSPFLDEKLCKTLCTALIQCHFDYSCSSWYPALSQKLKNKLQILQNKTVKFILNLDSRSHVDQLTLNKLSMLFVKDRVTQLKMNHVFNIFNKLSTPYLSQNFQLFSDIHGYATRNSPCNFILPRAKGQACNTFYFTGIQEWNSLPTQIKIIINSNTFKCAIKHHLSSDL